MLLINPRMHARAYCLKNYDNSAHLHTLRRLADHHFAEILNVVHILERNPVLLVLLVPVPVLVIVSLLVLESGDFISDILCWAMACEISHSMIRHGAFRTHGAQVLSRCGLRQALLEIQVVLCLFYSPTLLRVACPAVNTNAVTVQCNSPCWLRAHAADGLTACRRLWDANVANTYRFQDHQKGENSDKSCDRRHGCTRALGQGYYI